MGVDGKRHWLVMLAGLLDAVMQAVISIFALLVTWIGLAIFMLLALIYLGLFLIWPVKKPKAADSRAGHEWRA